MATLHKYQNDYQRQREGIHILQIEFQYHVRTLSVFISCHHQSSYCKYISDTILDIIIHPHYVVFQKHYIIVSQKYISTFVYDIVHLYPTCYCLPPFPITEPPGTHRARKPSFCQRVSGLKLPVVCRSFWIELTETFLEICI